MPKLSKILMKDVMIVPQILGGERDSEGAVYSESLWEESLELFLNLVSVK